MVIAPPDEEAPDVAAAGQPVFVQVNSEQTAVSLVVDPVLVLVLVQITCTGRSHGGKRKIYFQSEHSVYELVKYAGYIISGTWTCFAIDAISDSLVTCHDVMLQHNICPLTDLKTQHRL